VLIRFIFLCLIIYALVLILRAFWTGRRNRSKQFDPRSRAEAEEMVLDPQCHSYLPKGEAIFQEGRYFCSRECANLYLSR
jgi:FtsZ-interacting cell division protein ZipA